jgi:hypothetical protein
MFNKIMCGKITYLIFGRRISSATSSNQLSGIDEAMVTILQLILEVLNYGYRTYCRK